jgi:NTE family protein
VITGVSGGSFTALAYGLYGDKLFAEYEQRFLKRDVQGEIVSRSFSPANWGKLSGTAWGRSELAAELYDEILFNNATFGDLNRGNGPFIMASATDISTGSRFVFNQRIFDVICSDPTQSTCRAPRMPRRCPSCLTGDAQQLWRHLQRPRRLGSSRSSTTRRVPPRGRPLAKAEQAFGDSVHRPYLHRRRRVSDNVGMRAVLIAGGPRGAA